MENIKELLKQQKMADKFGKLLELREINKRIFVLREQERKHKAQQQEKKRESLIAKQIEEKMTGLGV